MHVSLPDSQLAKSDFHRPRQHQRGDDGTRMMCSVVIPVYNERDNVRAMHEALCSVADAEASLDWEFLFVEDGSTDDTFAILAELNHADPRVKVVRLSRNYGSHTGAAAGLHRARLRPPAEPHFSRRQRFGAELASPDRSP